MEVDTLKELLVEEVKDLLSAETQLVKAMPKMAKKAKSPELKAAFETHLAETQVQVDRLVQVLESLGEKAKAKKCLAMEGLIKEAQEHMSEDASPEVMDASMIGIAQKIEHYEIAGYGTCRTYAKLLGNKDVETLLKQTLDEEGNTDKLLTKIAVAVVNPKMPKME